MTLRQKKQAQKILKTLEGQRFYDFYVGADCEFDDYLQNRVFKTPAHKKEAETKMLQRITSLFELK